VAAETTVSDSSHQMGNGGAKVFQTSFKLALGIGQRGENECKPKALDIREESWPCVDGGLYRLLSSSQVF
jgi:hypothetical protein